MDSELAELTAELTKSPGASLAVIRDREAELGITFPDDYVEFMLSSNGGEGFVGGDRLYVQIDPIEEMMNDDLREGLARERRGLVVFGSDGAGEAFAFDTRGDEVRIVMFPWVGVDEKEVFPQGRTFTEFLRRAPVWPAGDHGPRSSS
jgi:hypothetical protein